MSPAEVERKGESLVENVHIRKSTALISPLEVKARYPASERSLQTVVAGREALRSAIQQTPLSKLIAVLGPCSIHDPAAALEYADWLKKQRSRYGDELELIMRVYFEKPRTTVGWEGLISDPDLNETFDFNKGLLVARKLVCDITDLGVPIGTEILDTITPDYYAGLVSWGAIGARTSESPLHKHTASGLSFPLGFKNGTEGNINIAIDAVETARHSHHFPGTQESGITAVFETTGNHDSHIILRGGKNGPNYDRQIIAEVVRELTKRKLDPVVMVDFSHGNSQKDFAKQLLVARDVESQIAEGNTSIMGVAIESNLVEGAQKFVPGGPFKYGVSITDGCAGLDDTQQMLEALYDARKTAAKNKTGRH